MKMNKPQASIEVAQGKVFFWFQDIEHDQLKHNVSLCKILLPSMKWIANKKRWTVSVDEFQQTYEAIRAMFGASNVRIQHLDYHHNAFPHQIPLINMEQ
jgi:hypothetical protein